MTKQIELSNGMYAMIDDSDFRLVSDDKWYPVKNRNTFYAVGVRGKFMHRVICGLSLGDKREVDHVDGNGLNNTRKNLRVVTRSQNSMNRKDNKNNTSGHRGVEFSKENNKWRARISLNGRTTHLGYFENIDDAIEARENAADKYFGEFRRRKS